MRLPRAGSAVRVVLSCEHARNHVPAHYARLFRGRRRLLASHRGRDPGRWSWGGRWHAGWACPSPRLFSEATRGLTRAERERLLDSVYRPYRPLVEARVAGALGAGGRVELAGAFTGASRPML